MKATYEWQIYDGDYEKKVQDIMLKDGTILLACWANADKWVQLEDDSDIVINNNDVYKVRLNKYEL